MPSQGENFIQGRSDCRSTQLPVVIVLASAALKCCEAINCFLLPSIDILIRTEASSLTRHVHYLFFFFLVACRKSCLYREVMLGRAVTLVSRIDPSVVKGSNAAIRSNQVSIQESLMTFSPFLLLFCNAGGSSHVFC